MKITSVRDTLKQTKSFDGLIKCDFEYAIKSATAKMEYSGPAIPKETWNQILSFFKWTYDTYHSESQVRLYVNYRTRTWAAWAFPQKARTGMTAQELDNDETKKQREQFKDSEGWLYFGTVHHHCSADAFQSSTDEANERGQDGMHITIGRMNSTHYDMHARFYLNGACFEPDMSLFWELGPEELVEMVPVDCWDRVARHQMTTPSAEPFPDIWKENIIEDKPAVTEYRGGSFYGYEGGYGSASYEPSSGPMVKKEDVTSKPWHQRVAIAAQEFINDTIRSGYQLEDAMDLVQTIEEDVNYASLETIAEEHRLAVSDITRTLVQWYENEAIRMEIEKDAQTNHQETEIKKPHRSEKKSK